LSTEKFSTQPIKSLSVKVEVKSEQPLASIYSPSHKVEIKRDGANRAVIGYESKDENQRRISSSFTTPKRVMSG